MNGKRSHRNEKLARIYDEEILPIWSQRFGKMILRRLDVPPRANVLDVACGTGFPALEILKRMDDQGRVIAIDSAPAMLDVARRKAGELSGKRIFFRSEDVSARLSFANDVYDLVLCNLGLNELASPRHALREFVRVCKPEGRVICTLPLAGTWQELYDIYREVLVKHDKHDMLQRLERHLRIYPEPEELERWMRSVGLRDVELEIEEFTLLFRSSREFFFAPLVEYGPLPRWKEVAGKGRELQDVFWYIKQAIDAYFGDRAFQVTVKAGCVRGRKPEGPISEQDTADFERLDEEDGIPLGPDEVMVLGDESEDTLEDEELEAFRERPGGQGEGEPGV